MFFNYALFHFVKGFAWFCLENQQTLWIILVIVHLSSSLQLSQSPLDKRPSYDAIQGANVTPTTFYNIGDFEVQDNLARIW